MKKAKSKAQKEKLRNRRKQRKALKKSMTPIKLVDLVKGAPKEEGGAFADKDSFIATISQKSIEGMGNLNRLELLRLLQTPASKEHIEYLTSEPHSPEKLLAFFVILLTPIGMQYNEAMQRMQEMGVIRNGKEAITLGSWTVDLCGQVDKTLGAIEAFAFGLTSEDPGDSDPGSEGPPKSEAEVLEELSQLAHENTEKLQELS